MVSSFPHGCCERFIPDSFDDLGEDGGLNVVPDFGSFRFFYLFNGSFLDEIDNG